MGHDILRNLHLFHIQTKQSSLSLAFGLFWHIITNLTILFIPLTCSDIVQGAIYVSKHFL